MSDIRLSLDTTTAKTLSYTYFKTGRQLIHEIAIRNIGPEETTGISVRPRVRVEAPGVPDVIQEWEGQPRELPRPQTVDPVELKYNDLRLGVNHVALGNLTDTLLAQITVEVLDEDDNIVGSSVKDLQILSPKDWVRDNGYPDSLAAFVLPGAEAVQSIVKDAREWLAQHKGSGDITVEDRGFQHTLDVAEAIYESIRNRAIHYSYEENADWDAVQRIRTPADILEKDLSGTCLDTSVLYAACLLEAHIQPLIFMTKTHAFAGFLNLDKIKADLGNEIDEAYLTPQMIRQAYSRGWLVSVETTLFCGGETSRNFKTACEWQSMDPFPRNDDELGTTVWKWRIGEDSASGNQCLHRISRSPDLGRIWNGSQQNLLFSRKGQNLEWSTRFIANSSGNLGRSSSISRPLTTRYFGQPIH